MSKILIVIISTILVKAAVTTAAVGRENASQQSGLCTCGVFPDNSQIPIIEQPLEFSVSCDDDGTAMCQNLCIALAQGARDQAPALICEKLNKHVDNLEVAVFTKTNCDDIKTEWKFTGLKNPDKICCEGGKDTICNSGPVDV